MYKRAAIRVLPAVLMSVVLAAAFILPSRSNVPSNLVSCTTGTFTANPASGAVAPASVLETATASCGAGTATFQFWEFDNPLNRWSMVQDWSTTNTHTWNTSILPCGFDYRLEVDVRSSDIYSSYEFVKNMTYHINCAPVVKCTAATLTVTGGISPTSGPTGGTFVMTGGSATCPNPRYKFWIMDPGHGWSVVQNYGISNTHTWGPIGTYYLGQYGMEVDVRDAASTDTYDVVANLTFTLVGCTAAGLTAAPTTAVHGVAPVTLTATSTCPGVPEYRFWIFDPGGTHWSIVKDYSSSNTYTWAAANQIAGISKIEVDVRNAGSREVYEKTTQGLTYTFS